MPDTNDLLVHVSRRAMAGEFEVCFSPAQCPGGTEIALDALDVVEHLEDQLSYFRPASQVSRINQLAAEGPVEVEPWLFELLQQAMQLHEETGGAYDITSAPLWEAWGFARRAGKIPSDADLAAARSLVGGHLVELDAARRTVRFGKPGVRLNLGSIGKGYALDACAGRLIDAGMADFLLQAGKSSVVAHGGIRHTPFAIGSSSRHTPCAVNNGSRHTPCADQGSVGDLPHARADGTRRVPDTWEIGIPHPRRPGQRLGVVRLDNRALGTSGGQFQSFRHQGRRFGHILDPRTGLPAEGVLSATAVAPTAAAADALSTAFYVMGPEGSLAYCRSRPEIGLVMACPGRGSEVVVHVAGLDRDWTAGTK
jgi:FAD:protein FMN transferase